MPLGTRSAADALPQERLTFIRKVYSLFFISLLFAVAGGAVCIQSGAYRWFAQHYIIALLLYFGGVFLVQGVARMPGINVIVGGKSRKLMKKPDLVGKTLVVQQGYRVGILGASEMGYNVYRRIGFQEYCKMGHYVWKREPEDATAPANDG